jgi:hypothetical protein
LSKKRFLLLGFRDSVAEWSRAKDMGIPICSSSSNNNNNNNNSKEGSKLVVEAQQDHSSSTLLLPPLLQLLHFLTMVVHTHHLELLQDQLLGSPLSLFNLKFQEQ